MSNDDEYTLDCATVPATAVLRGVLRLQSTESYDKVFAPIRQRLGPGADAGPYTIDLRDVVLMNSSGIRALAALVLLAKDNQIPLVIRVRDSIPWQRKTIASLKLLDRTLDVRAI